MNRRILVLALCASVVVLTISGCTQWRERIQAHLDPERAIQDARWLDAEIRYWRSVLDGIDKQLADLDELLNLVAPDSDLARAYRERREELLKARAELEAYLAVREAAWTQYQADLEAATGPGDVLAAMGRLAEALAPDPYKPAVAAVWGLLTVVLAALGVTKAKQAAASTQAVDTLVTAVKATGAVEVARAAKAAHNAVIDRRVAALGVNVLSDHA